MFLFLNSVERGPRFEQIPYGLVPVGVVTTQEILPSSCYRGSAVYGEGFLPYLETRKGVPHHIHLQVLSKRYEYGSVIGWVGRKQPQLSGRLLRCTNSAASASLNGRFNGEIQCEKLCLPVAYSIRHSAGHCHCLGLSSNREAFLRRLEGGKCAGKS